MCTFNTLQDGQMCLSIFWNASGYFGSAKKFKSNATGKHFLDVEYA